MIISCNNCNKKFELDSDLVPGKGRLLECSACNYQWFFKKEITGKIDKPTLDSIFVNTENTLVPRRENENLNNENLIEKDIYSTENKEKDLIPKTDKKKIKILNYIIVFIISFVALIIIIDTFKSSISKSTPAVEFILYNLYETIKDIILFFKDLV